MNTQDNPTGLKGIRFVEWARPADSDIDYDALFMGFGFSRLAQLPGADVTSSRCITCIESTTSIAGR